MLRDGVFRFRSADPQEVIHEALRPFALGDTRFQLYSSGPGAYTIAAEDPAGRRLGSLRFTPDRFSRKIAELSDFEIGNQNPATFLGLFWLAYDISKIRRITTWYFHLTSELAGVLAGHGLELMPFGAAAPDGKTPDPLRLAQIDGRNLSFWRRLFRERLGLACPA